jgi:drug/metabolite transporter (DMT)-like permease
VILGLLLSVGAALGTSLGFLFKQRGAVLVEPIQARHPLLSAVHLFRSRWFTVGWLVSLAAWGLHIGALSLAPLSMVQVVMAAGLVFLALLAERFFGFHLGRRQWVGLTITAAGLALIGLTGLSQGAGRSSTSALIVVECAIFGIGIGLVRLATRSGVDRRPEGLLLAAGAGVLFAVSDVSIKYLSHAHGPAFGLLSPWTVVALMAFVVSFYASARSLQIGEAVEVIAIMSVAANLSAILGGILVFGESIGSGGVGVAARVLAFCLVIAGAALVPAPHRAGRRAPLPASAIS